MQLVILCGGKATRLYPRTYTIPKSMIEICGKPFIYWQLHNVKNAGITDVVLCTGFKAEQIKDYVKDGKEFGLNVHYSDDGDNFLGTGGAVKKALPLLKDYFYLTYGDSYLDLSCIGKLNQYTMTIYKNDNQLEPSNIEFDNKIIKYDKKNLNERMKYIDYGISYLDKEAFTEEGVFDLSDTLKRLIADNKMNACIATKRFYEMGSEKGIKEMIVKLTEKEGLTGV